VAFVNMLTGLAAYAPNGNDVPVSQVPVSSIDEYSTWSFGGDEGGGYMAVRPVHDSGQNLNIPGDGPYRPGPVITYAWGSGPWNSQWTCIPFGAPYLADFDAVSYASFFRGLFARVGLSASVNPTAPTGQLVTQNKDTTQQGQLFFPAIYFSSGMPYGVALANVQTGMSPYVPVGNGNPVTQVPLTQLSANSVWSLGGDEGNRYFALRPVEDTGQNLNIPGDGPYTPGMGLITWGWGGGDSNEVWTWMVPSATPVAAARSITKEMAS
jgi:hypothetical protein